MILISYNLKTLGSKKTWNLIISNKRSIQSDKFLNENYQKERVAEFSYS